MTIAVLSSVARAVHAKARVLRFVCGAYTLRRGIGAALSLCAGGAVEGAFVWSYAAMRVFHEAYSGSQVATFTTGPAQLKEGSRLRVVGVAIAPPVYRKG
jgi:hypothetical protein